MSLLIKVARKLGVYDHFRTHFIETLLRPYATRSQVTAPEAQLLGRLVREAGPGPIVEVGTLFGASAKIIMANMQPGQTLICVDNFRWNPSTLTVEEHAGLTRAVLKRYAADVPYTIVQEDKNHFYETYDGPPPAMVFLDADHSFEETCKDIAWARKVGTRVISGHDYKPDQADVIRAVDHFGGPGEKAGSAWRLRDTVDGAAAEPQAPAAMASS